MRNELYIIPQKNFGIICKVENNILTKIREIDIHFDSKNVFLENGLIVSLGLVENSKTNELKIFNMEGKKIFECNEYNYSAINVFENVVYLGGIYSNNRELFSYVDLSSIEFKINDVSLPIKTVDGKSIDDILISNNLLYLIDNIIWPKYIFIYDINVSNRPKYLETHKLTGHLPNEEIIKGDINDNWIMIFSEHYIQNGFFYNIVLKNIEKSWKKDYLLTFCTQGSGLFEKVDSVAVLDVCLTNNMLYILKEDGLYIIKLDSPISKRNIYKFNENRDMYKKMLKIGTNSVILYNEFKYEHIKI